jgi:hypothetical protein
VLVVTERLVRAGRKHFPREDAQQLTSPADAEEATLQGKMEMEGDSAWLVAPGGTRETAARFTRVGGAWKTDIEKTWRLESRSGKEKLQAYVDASGALEVMEEVVQQIDDGRIRTLAEMQARLEGAVSRPAAGR